MLKWWRANTGLIVVYAITQQNSGTWEDDFHKYPFSGKYTMPYSFYQCTDGHMKMELLNIGPELTGYFSWLCGSCGHMGI